MWIVAIGWSYVVILMAATETSIVAGIMTFLIYCMIPLSILFYLTGSKRRRARRALVASRAQSGRDNGAVPLAPTASAGATNNTGCRGDAGFDGACDGGDGGGGGGGD